MMSTLVRLFSPVMRTTIQNAPSRRLKSTVPQITRRIVARSEPRGSPLRTRAGNYLPLSSFFDSYARSFLRDCRQSPEVDFRLLQAQQGWKPGTNLYTKARRAFLTAMVTESKSPVHAFFVRHKRFLEYDPTASPYRELARLQRLNSTPVARREFGAAFRAEFKSPLDSFFLTYPTFLYNPRSRPMTEFDRLVFANGWDPERAYDPEHENDPESRAYKRALRAFFHSFREEFDSQFGSDGEAIETWQKLCAVLDVVPVPGSAGQCKKATRPLMINIYDLTHHMRNGAPFQFFKTLADLSAYTFKHNLIFPKKLAKQSALKYLLRSIMEFEEWGRW